MKINIEIEHRGKTIQDSKILSNEEINNCTLSIGTLLHETISQMENNVIKGFLNVFTEYGKQSEANSET